jgi:large subunit ribosomal protein L9
VRVEVEEKEREAQISARIEALGKITLSVVEKADATGTLYGSVGPATIVKLLARAGVEAEEKDIRLEEPIKSVGTHEIPIHVWGEHYAGIQIVVEAETS